MEKVIFTIGIMDMCHKGHLNLLRKMRETGKKTVVVLHTDESCYRIKGKIPIQHIGTRLRNLQITGLVDEMLITDNDDPTPDMKKLLKKYPDIEFMRGDDNPTYPGYKFIESYIPHTYIKYTKDTSSSKLRIWLSKLFS